MYHNDINHVVSSMVLKPSHCYALLNAEPSVYKKNKIGIRDLKAQSVELAKGNIEELAEKCKFDNSKEQWNLILANATYSQKTKEIKFNINKDDPGFVYKPVPRP